jgi:hypothetical protein
MFFLAGSDSPEYVPMRNMSSRDMQMMEYLKWTLSIKCACYQISPQDIGFVMDYHRSTAETQKELVKSRGIKNLLSLVETYFNTEIVKKEFPFRDVKFQWQGIDLSDESVQASIDIGDINTGVISRNDRRKRLGLPAVEGGDTILVNVGQQFVPIEKLVSPEEAPEAEQPMEEAMKEKEQGGEATSLAQDKQNALEGTVDRTTQPSAGKPVFAKPAPKPAPEAPMSEEDKTKIVRMIVNYTQQDKIAKAMDVLKEQGLGNNEIKISLEE